MADQPTVAAKSSGRILGLFKALALAGFGLGSGVVATYATAVVDRVTKPGKPVANFAVSADGLTVTCQNHATGESGWWDFGDGTPLEAFVPDKPATHTFPKPGNYSVRLTVRNFLMDEAERSVPVDLTAAAPQQLPPTITGLTVEPIGAMSVAPATFRIKGEVKNAERVIWDLGDKLDVTTEPGPFERLVVFERPGQYPIQLIGHTGKQAIKQAATVTVTSPAAGSLSAIVRVSDTGVRTDRTDFTEVMTIAIPTTAAPGFEKLIPARPGFTIVSAKLGSVKGTALSDLTTTVTPDRKSVKLSGKWTGSGDVAKKAAGGSDVLIPVTVTEERTTPIQLPPETVSGSIMGWGALQTATLPLPPQPRGLTGLKRTMRLEIREASSTGPSRVLVTVPELKLPWSAPLPGTVGLAGRGTVSAVLIGEQIRVNVSH